MSKPKLVLVLTLLTLSSPAIAYIDPGSGSAIMSAIVGFFVAIAMVAKSYWYKLKSMFSSAHKADVREQGEADSGKET